MTIGLELTAQKIMLSCTEIEHWNVSVTLGWLGYAALSIDISAGNSVEM
jgi:hypothetical protein